MKQMFEHFTTISISKGAPHNDYTEFVLKEKKGTPEKFSINILTSLVNTNKIVVINAEKFLESAALRKAPPSSHNTKTVDFAIIDFRKINTPNSKEVVIYLIEMGNHSPSELKLKYNSTFSILIAFISKYLQLNNLNPDDSYSFKCSYNLVHVIETELKTEMISDQRKNISKHSEYDFNIIEVSPIDYGRCFSDLESLPKNDLIIKSLTVK